MATETLSEELGRLVDEYERGERQNRAEAWNLIADFAVTNCNKICAALTAAEQVRASEAHELVAFLTLWAGQYQRDYKLDGIHPIHYALMEKYGCRMDSFKKATNAWDI